MHTEDVPTKRKTRNSHDDDALDLPAIRKLTGITQVEAAKTARWDQSELSKFERRDDFLLSTLRRYVKALGGRVEVTIHLGRRAIRLKGG